MSKNVPLSLSVPPHVRDALRARAAASEIPVKPATLAAHLLARALTVPEQDVQAALKRDALIAKLLELALPLTRVGGEGPMYKLAAVACQLCEELQK